MKYLFIDSNIWLSLYHFTNDDLEQFRELKRLVNSDICLLIPRQVKDEVLRNRETKVKDALNKFVYPKIQYPTFCRNYDEFESFDSLIKQGKEEFDKWYTKIQEDIKNQSLSADKAIKDFFSVTEIINCTEDIIKRAVNRYNVGNPPGKDGKYGDAINWECIFDVVPEGEDLFIITADKDYYSVLNQEAINPFLKNEWEEKKKSKVFIYKTLVDFLKEQLQSIQLKTEQEKEELIWKLCCSHAFEETHKIIGQLKDNTDWTESQVEELCKAVINNTQVEWILGDSDIFEFYYDLLFNNSSPNMESESVRKVVEKIIELNNARQ